MYCTNQVGSRCSLHTDFVMHRTGTLQLQPNRALMDVPLALNVDMSSVAPPQSVSTLQQLASYPHLLTILLDFMAYCRGSKDDWNRWAQVTGDQGWSWNSIINYAKKSENFVEPIDGRDVSGEVIQSSHGHSGMLIPSLCWRLWMLIIRLIGPLRTSVPMYPVSTDSRVLNTTAQLPAEFPFNQDYNSVSGNTLGVGWAQFTVCSYNYRFIPLMYSEFIRLLTANVFPPLRATSSPFLAAATSTSSSTPTSPSFSRPVLRAASP